MDKKIAGIIVGVIVLIGGSFYAGTQYGSKNSPSLTGRTGQFAGNRAGTVRNMTGGLIVGEVLSKDTQGITVKMRDGGSNIVFIGKTTTISKSATGSIDDIALGLQVMVTGTKNPDGSTSAQSVQIRPELPKK